MSDTTTVLTTQRLLFKCLAPVLLVCALAFAPAHAQQKAGGAAAGRQTSKQGRAIAYYSCPMDRDVKAKKSGKCPKCGMDLRPAYADEVTPEAGASSGKAVAPASSATRVEGTPDVASRMQIPDVELLDQDGRKMHFYTDLVKGKTVAINFIFTTCTTICPPLGATFARVQKELGERAGRDVFFISISVDPTTDTPERLKAWGAKFKAGESWTFVTGDKPAIDTLLSALGAASARREDHSPTVLIGNDARGIWMRAYGLSTPGKLLQLINDTAEGKTTPTPKETSQR
ncbi:MAG: SCO family protein [Pyrinomonadaceae bacterium]